MQHVSRAQVKKLVGKSIYAVRRDGSVVTGKLIALRGNRLIMSSGKRRGKGRGLKREKARTSFFFFPLLLFSLISIGSLGFYGGFGYGGFGYGGFGGCGCGIPNCGCGFKGGFPGSGFY